mmetsp:Transcript_42760/g.101497  ORF Transcript_42760/g.101497 Transcript_42760/m.101497 type:complete len:210 (+) Transcript_42760:292-921(+)
MSQRLMEQSCEAEAQIRPSGWIATLNTKFLWPARVCRHWQVTVSHNLTVKSRDPVARIRALGLNAREYTVFSCARDRSSPSVVPSSITALRRLVTSQIRTVPSRDPETTMSLTGRNLTEAMKPVCPRMVRMRRPLRVSARMTLCPWQPEARSSPLAWNETAMTGDWWRCSAWMHIPLATFQIRVFWSWLAVTQITPSCCSPALHRNATP